MNRTFNLKALMLAVALLVLTSTQGRAALPVVDYGNLTQSLLQVTHAVTQIQNQIQQINQLRAFARQGSVAAPVVSARPSEVESQQQKMDLLNRQIALLSLTQPRR